MWVSLHENLLEVDRSLGIERRMTVFRSLGRGKSRIVQWVRVSTVEDE